MAGDPQVVQLNDHGKRKVMLRFTFAGVDLELELVDPASVERAIQSARIWVSEG